MKIHPATTPLEKVRVGNAIAKLPYHTEQEVIAIPPERRRKAREFVRFLTEQNGRMVHVWKRTK